MGTIILSMQQLTMALVTAHLFLRFPTILPSQFPTSANFSCACRFLASTALCDSLGCWEPVPLQGQHISPGQTGKPQPENRQAQSQIMRSQASFTSLSASAAFAFICSHFASKKSRHRDRDECGWQIIQPRLDSNLKMYDTIQFFLRLVDGEKKTIKLHALAGPFPAGISSFGLCIIIRLARSLASGFQSSEGLG